MPILLKKEIVTRHLFSYLSEEVRKVRYRLWDQSNLSDDTKDTSDVSSFKRSDRRDLWDRSVINFSFYLSFFFYILTVSFIFFPLLCGVVSIYNNIHLSKLVLKNPSARY